MINVLLYSFVVLGGDKNLKNMDVTEISLAPTMIAEFHRQIRAFPPERSGGWPRTQVVEVDVPEKKKRKTTTAIQNQSDSEKFQKLLGFGNQITGRMIFFHFSWTSGGPLAKSLIALPQLWPDTSPWLWWRFVVESHGC